MVDWAAVAAYIGPLVAAMVAVSTWFTYLGKRRDDRVAGQIREATATFEARLVLVETQLGAGNKQLERQAESLLQTMQAVARIEGRLAGQSQAPGAA